MKQKKRELILDAMQVLMQDRDLRFITVDDIAREAGIGKGSIYYYFSSKSQILSALVERSYSAALEEGRRLAASPGMDVFTKLEILFSACLRASSELARGEAKGERLLEIQQSALIHQEFLGFLLKSLQPILSDVLAEGTASGQLTCPDPQAMARIILSVLGVFLDNHLAPASKEEIRGLLATFAWMQEASMGLPAGKLDFLKDGDRAAGTDPHSGKPDLD